MPAKKSKNKQDQPKRKRSKNEIVPTMLRMKEELRKKISESARKNANSMNEEMVKRLEVSYDRDEFEHRDTIIVETMTGHYAASADLLRNFVVELQRAQQMWRHSDEAKKRLIDCLSFYITRGDIYDYESYDEYLARTAVLQTPPDSEGSRS